MATYKLFSSDGEFIGSFKYKYKTNHKKRSVESELTDRLRSNDTYMIERWENYTMVKKEIVRFAAGEGYLP